METLIGRKNSERGRDSAEDRVVQELRTSNQLLAVLVTRGMEQKDSIALLHALSFTPRAIAAALSITPNAVNIAIHRMRKSESVTVTQAGVGAEYHNPTKKDVQAAQAPIGKRAPAKTSRKPMHDSAASQETPGNG